MRGTFCADELRTLLPAEMRRRWREYERARRKAQQVNREVSCLEHVSLSRR